MDGDQVEVEAAPLMSQRLEGQDFCCALDIQSASLQKEWLPQAIETTRLIVCLTRQVPLNLPSRHTVSSGYTEGRQGHSPIFVR